MGREPHQPEVLLNRPHSDTLEKCALEDQEEQESGKNTHQRSGCLRRWVTGVLARSQTHRESNRLTVVGWQHDQRKQELIPCPNEEEHHKYR